MLDAARIRPLADRPGGTGQRRQWLAGAVHRTGTSRIAGGDASRACARRIGRGRRRQGGDRESRGRHAGPRTEDVVETAGPDIVGVCLDSGNPVWTIEDPHLTLDTLAPYVLTSHMRDSALWKTPEGIAVRWTRMGEGNMGIEQYLRTYVQTCLGKAVSLEVIVSGQPRMFNYANPRGLGALSQPAGLGVRAIPGPCREGQPEPRASSRPGQNAGGPQSRKRGGEHSLDQGVPRNAVVLLRQSRPAAEIDLVIFVTG